MYIPHQFQIHELDEIKAFAARVRAADLVTVSRAGLPMVTLMPFVWEPSAERAYGKLVMHMARANTQWKEIGNQSPGLAIIRGHQAYVSPTNYENKEIDHKAVPTWNYQSLHLTGTVEVSEDKDLLRKIVLDLSRVNEASRQAPWDPADTDPHYLELLLKGIVAVTLNISRVEAKYKLSQNKSSADQERIIADLMNSEIPGERHIAEEMTRNLG